MQQNPTVLLLGRDDQLMSGLVHRLGRLSIDAKECEEVMNVSSIILTSVGLSKSDQEVLERTIKKNDLKRISIIQIVPLQDVLHSHMEFNSNSLKRIIDQSDGKIDYKTVYTPLFYEDLINNRDSFFIHNVDNTQNIVRYYGDSELRFPLISKLDLISFIVTLLDSKSNHSTENEFFIRGDLIRIETIVMSLFGRRFQYENVKGRPGEEQLALKWSQIIRKVEMAEDLLIPMNDSLRWNEFLTH